MGVRRARLALLALVGVLWLSALAEAVECPATAKLAVYVDNQSDDETVTLQVSGDLLDSSGTCSLVGATHYEETLTCNADDLGFCGVVPGLRPGAWAHTVTTTVTGSDEQHQGRQLALVGGGDASNVLEWTVYPRTFRVDLADEDELRAELQAATEYTALNPGRYALVTFARGAFRSAQEPGIISLGYSVGQSGQNVCDETSIVDCAGRDTRLCLEGSRLVVDALDDRGDPGAVVLTIGTCANSVIRVIGSDDVLRGLDVFGSLKDAPSIDLDTIVFSGAAAQRNRLESMIVRGPTKGDAISAEDGAGAPGGTGDGDVVIQDSVIMGAEDKGVKVIEDSHVTIADSCIHDNRNGGVQATLGGHARVERSAVQFNVPGKAENGLSVGVPEDAADHNTLETDGNVIRFAGSRGISVVNNADAVLLNDFVAENQDAGIRVETTKAGVMPAASGRGMTFACNYAEISRPCVAESSTRCVRNSECTISCGGSTPDGFGVSVGVGACAGCLAPLLDLGPDGNHAGRNALTQNANPESSDGINFANGLGSQLVARGNQWERCGDGLVGVPGQCDVAAVEAEDMRPAGSVDIGTPTVPRGGPAPAIVDVWPRRPRKGDMVRVYNGVLAGQGGPFNAIDGIACRAGDVHPVTGFPLGIPDDHCDVRSPEVAAANHESFRGNKVELAVGDEVFALDTLDVHAVTPSMLIFEMPVDCYAPATLQVFRGSDPSAVVTFCDPGGCTGMPAGTRCDDGDACTIDDRCNEDEVCVSGPPLVCDGTCQRGTCDPALGCVLEPAGAACEEGDLCTAGDTCTAKGQCVAGEPRTCSGDCLSGACVPSVGCLPRPETTACDDGDACTENDRCSGLDERCVGGSARVCGDDGDVCTLEVCDAVVGCTSEPARDGLPCPAVDACHGPAACLAGGCDPGPPITCDDGDVCTEDACDPLLGCTAGRLPAFEVMLCRASEIRALLDGAGTLRKKTARKLRKCIGGFQRAVMRAHATNVPARANRQLKRADKRLAKFLGTLYRERRRLEGSLERELRRSAQDAATTITALRAGS